MPTLPTITVTDQQAARIMEAYAPGGTQAEAAKAYRNWLRNGIRDKVLLHEQSITMQTIDAELGTTAEA